MKAILNHHIRRLVEKHGKLYISAPLPPDISYGKVGWCYDMCAVKALASKGKYQYVEGIATDPEKCTWLLHAWLTDGQYAFDPTWSYFNNTTKMRINVQLPTVYIGIAMPIDKVVEFMIQTGYQGIIPNRNRAPTLAKSLIGGL